MAWFTSSKAALPCSEESDRALSVHRELLCQPGRTFRKSFMMAVARSRKASSMGQSRSLTFW
jgi:hypothetical protein